MTLAAAYSPLGIYLSIVILLTMPPIAIGIVNLFAFRRPKAIVAGGDGALPSISVLVPARNEERVIERCVRTLLAQNYPDFEVVVLDDSSSDATYDVLCRLRDQDPRLRVLAGAALPEDWCGKAFALRQLAQAARSQYLLLTDADCEFSPDALLMAVGAASEYRADVVSLAPDYVALTFWERLIIPLLVVIPLAFLPLPLVRGSRCPLYSAANGTFIFLDRATYLEIDGHVPVRDQLAEDLKFARHVKRSGKTLWYGDGGRAYRVRMYDGPAGIRRGFTRNPFPAFSCKLGVLVPTLAYMAIVFVLPPVLALVGWSIGAAWTWLALVPYLMFVALRIAIALMLGRDSPAYALLNPLAWALVCGMAIESVVKHRNGYIEWKGRVYGDSKRIRD
jgi:chlorobactene glucosyltransferase